MFDRKENSHWRYCTDTNIMTKLWPHYPLLHTLGRRNWGMGLPPATANNNFYCVTVFIWLWCKLWTRPEKTEYTKLQKFERKICWRVKIYNKWVETFCWESRLYYTFDINNFLRDSSTVLCSAQVWSTDIIWTRTVDGEDMSHSVWWTLVLVLINSEQPQTWEPVKISSKNFNFHEEFWKIFGKFT